MTIYVKYDNLCSHFKYWSSYLFFQSANCRSDDQEMIQQI